MQINQLAEQVGWEARKDAAGWHVLADLARRAEGVPVTDAPLDEAWMVFELLKERQRIIRKHQQIRREKGLGGE
jgi:hypothetical protein